MLSNFGAPKNILTKKNCKKGLHNFVYLLFLSHLHFIWDLYLKNWRKKVFRNERCFLAIFVAKEAVTIATVGNQAKCPI